jgi:MFS family permease
MNPWRGIGQLPKEIWLLSITTLINRMGTMGLPFLIVYLTKSLGYSATEAGLVLTIYGAAALVAAPFSGQLSDAIGPLRVMKLSLFLSGVVLVLFPLAKSYPAIIIATILWSIIGEAFRPASLAIISDAVESGRRRVAFSANRLAVNLGMSIGPALGGILLLYSFPLIFWIDGATSLIAGFVLTLTMKVEPQHHRSSDEFRATRKYPFDDRRLLFFVAIIFPIFVTFFQHVSTLPYVFVQELMLSPSLFGFLFTINTVLILLVEIPLNLSMAHWSHRHSLALGSLLVGLGYGGMMFVTGFWSVAITVVIWTFGEMIFLPSASAYVAEIALPERRGIYMGVFQMTGNAAFAFSAWFGMKLLEGLGASMFWGVIFAVCVISAILLLRLQEQHSRSQVN